MIGRLHARAVARSSSAGAAGKLERGNASPAQMLGLFVVYVCMFMFMCLLVVGVVLFVQMVGVLQLVSSRRRPKT